jgi:hypothetical protein
MNEKPSPNNQEQPSKEKAVPRKLTTLNEGEKFIPDDPEERKAELADLCQVAVTLAYGVRMKILTSEEEAELRSWVDALPYEQLGEEMQKQYDRIDNEVRKTRVRITRY